MRTLLRLGTRAPLFAVSDGFAFHWGFNTDVPSLRGLTTTTTTAAAAAATRGLLRPVRASSREEESDNEWRTPRPLDIVASTGAWSRIVAVGDIHGDNEALLKCLKSARVIDESGAWIAERGTLLMSCGDILDRGREELECMLTLASLKEQARGSGSDVSMVLGNHEVGNVRGDTFWAHKASSTSIASYFFPTVEDIRAGRKQAFAPGGPAAELLAQLCDKSPIWRKEGDTIFVHAAWNFDTEASADSLNAFTVDWLLGRSEYLGKEFEKLVDRVYGAANSDRYNWQLYDLERDNHPPDCKRVVAGHIFTSQAPWRDRQATLHCIRSTRR